MPKQNLTDDEFIEKMTAGESPVGPSPTRSEQALRAYMEAANPRASIKEQPLGPGVVGAVRSTNPDEILLGSGIKQSPAAREGTVLHELEHSLSLRGGNPLGAVSRSSGEPITTDNNYRFDLLYNMGDKKIENPSVKDIRRMRETGEGEKKRLAMIHNFVKNKNAIEEFFGRPIDSSYFHPNMFRAQVLYGTEGALFAEQIADLSALEQLTGKSLTRDKEMKKLLFPDDRSAQIYDAITGYRQTRLDSKDLPPYTPVFPKEPGMLDRLKSLLGMQEGGEVSNDQFIEQMTVGTLPADAQEGKAEAAFRALVEGGQGFLGLEPGRKGTEAYRTGQALANIPPVALPLMAVKAVPKVAGAVEDVATRAVQRITENPDLSAVDIYNAMFGKQAPGVPITTYHGSGNLFQQLDPTKAKSGVGEQRYGMGAGYTAESRPVAESFIGAEAQALRASGGMDPKLEFVYDLVSQKRSDKDVLDMVAARYGDAVSFDEAADILQKAKAMTKGYLYKGDIPDEILPSFLDWNKSLKQQTPEVKKLLGKDPLVKESADPKRWNEVSGGIIQKGEGGLDDLTGDSIYKYISLKLGSDSAATQYLDKLGVRGIRYADPGSKGLGRAPSGTSNFVVFRPEDYRIESVNDMPVGKTVSSPKAVKQIFEQAEKLPTNQFIDEVMSAHIGGVGDFGDESAKYYLSQIPGGPAYIKASQELARKNLGNQFMAYRLMPKDQFEALHSGDVGDLLSFSLSQSSAEALKKFVKNQKRDDLVVAEVPLTPEHVIAFGSPSEQEVIIDTGVGWSMDQFKQAAPLKKAEGGEVSNEDFIEQMTVGTRPTDQEAAPYDQTAAARLADYLRAPVDLAQTAVRGTIGAVVGPAYGLYKGVTGGKYGTAEGVREASTAGGELMQKITGEPKSQAAKDVLGFIGEQAEALKLAPMPQLMTAPLPGRGAVRFQGEAAKGAVEDIALRAVRAQTQNPDITAAQLYNAMLGKQAPGVPVVKPTAGAPAISAPKNQMGFYSAVEDTILNLPQEKGTAQQFLAQISKAPGVKMGELKATGLEEFLKSKGTAPVTREEVRSFLDSNKVQVDEVVLGKGQMLSPEAKRLADEAYDRMGVADNKMAPFFEQMSASNAAVGGQEPYSMFWRIRGPLARELARGDQDAINELYALNLPPDVRQAALDFAAAKQEYQAYAKQARRIEKPRFDKYNIPGGENAREIYLTLPGSKGDVLSAEEVARLNELAQKRIGSSLDGLSPSEQSEYFNLIGRREKAGAAFSVPSSHSVSPEADRNRLAHIFLDDRTDAEGKKVLFVQELQSDWAQQGRDKGFVTKQGELPAGWQTFQDKKSGDWYVVDNTKTQVGVYAPTREEAIFSATVGSNKGIPAAPFVTTTEDWVNLALKRVINEAVENGYDKVAFISGKQAADKYRLSTVLKGIEVSPLPTTYISSTKQVSPGSRVVELKRKDGGIIEMYVNKEGEIEAVADVPFRQLTGKPLSEVVGKEMAEKVMATELKDKDSTIFTVKDMEVGGEGMKGFYDNVLPKTANKLLAKLGSKIEPVVMEKEVPIWSKHASSFKDWMTVNHPEVSSADAARAWAMGMENNSFVKEYYEATKPMEQLGFRITPEMVEMVKTKGLPQFAAGGEVTKFIKAHA